MADVCTQTELQMAHAQAQDSDLWDADEHYPVADLLVAWFPAHEVSFEPFSYCSGIITLRPDTTGCP